MIVPHQEKDRRIANDSSPEQRISFGPAHHCVVEQLSLNLALQELQIQLLLEIQIKSLQLVRDSDSDVLVELHPLRSGLEIQSLEARVKIVQTRGQGLGGIGLEEAVEVVAYNRRLDRNYSQYYSYKQ